MENIIYIDAHLTALLPQIEPNTTQSIVQFVGVGKYIQILCVHS